MFQTAAIYTDIASLKSQFSACPPSNDQMQKLLRLLHQVLLSCKRSEEASQVSIVKANMNFDKAKRA
jgi:translation initiation factor 3 subunit M